MKKIYHLLHHSHVNRNINNGIKRNALIICLFAGALFLPFVLLSQVEVEFTTPGTTQWQAPAGVNFVTVELWGGGGAGGGNNNSGGSGGGGGGGGYTITINASVIPGNFYNITVGSGGVPGVSSGNGGNSIAALESTYTANGGGGGSWATFGGDGGSGGSGSNFTGGSGSDGSLGNWGGGGGSSAGTASNGNSVNDSPTGATAVTGGGPGGNGNTEGNGFSPASGPGGGGGGARSPAFGPNYSGGNGAAGMVRLTYCPKVTASAIKTDASCFENSDGQIVITASGGTGPYTYSIDNGNNYEISNTFSELAQGEYRIRVKDANGCESPEIP